MRAQHYFLDKAQKPGKLVNTMGLDMYLKARRYFSKRADSSAFENVVKAAGIESFIDNENFPLISIDFTVGYWRKANSIHKWFVDNIQGGVDKCQLSYVSREDLGELLEICEAVLASPENAPSLLPTANGFSFGGTDYDDGYIYDLNNTVSIIKKALDMPEDFELAYQASW